MTKTFFAARLTNSSEPTYLWKFRKDTRRGMYGAKRIDNTMDLGRIMLRATATSIMDNIRDAEQVTNFRYEIAEFEVVQTFSAYTVGIQGVAARRAAQIDGAFFRTIGDYVYVLRAKGSGVSLPEVVAETNMPVACEGKVQKFGDAVTLTASDWDLISDAIRTARSEGVLSDEVEARLAAMTFVECEMIEQ